MNPQDDPNHDTDDKRAKEKAEAESAATLIRQKLDSLYAEEPNVKQEVKEVIEAGRPRSKHQQFMYDLSNSGKSLAEIQTAWHSYYLNLPESEKHEVWQEFYAANNHNTRAPQTHIQPETPKPELKVETKDNVKPAVTHATFAPPQPLEAVNQTTHLKNRRAPIKAVRPDFRSVADIKEKITKTSRSGRKLKAHQHLQSLLFGIGLGSLVILILLFSFFNERFIAPFITPSRHVSSTPIITDLNGIAPSSNPEVIIPKINVEIPVVYDEPSIAEAAVETALERGVVHYATTPSPGEQGNVVIFGHSSNNIFNPGKYKFAFVLLSRLDTGDTFYLTRNGKLFAYKVYKKQIVQPDAVSVLGSADKPDTATLITCDPPGTSLHRLVVTGEQVSPDPTANTASTAIKTDVSPTSIPSNAPSLWQRFKSWLTS